MSNHLIRVVVLAASCCLQFQLSAEAPTPATAEDYLGSKPCAKCHAEISDRYSRTAMARASGLASELKLPSGIATATKAHATYALSQTPDGIRLEYRKNIPSSGPISGSKLLKYFIGSGDHGRGFVFEDQGQPFQAPVAYYPDRHNGWDLAPGYEDESSIFLSRKVDSNCLGCHASGLAAAGPASKDSLLFTEGAVSCERCHGPGEGHVRATSTGDMSHSLAIVNPAKLQAQARDSVCAQCHLFGQSRVNKPHRSPQTFRPGDRLTDHVVSFEDRSSASQNFKVIGHFEGLWASKCKRVSGDQLWCGTCHDPHGSPTPAAKVAYFRDKCNSCHEKLQCALPLASRDVVDNSCIACHMQRRETTDGQHTSFTDHSIPRKSGSPKQSLWLEDAAKSVTDLVPFWPTSVTARDTALAEADAGFQDRDRLRLQRAFQKLKAILPTVPQDAEVLSQLAYLYQLNGDSAAAITLYKRCLLVDPSNLIALTNLGGHLAQMDQKEAAINLWRQALGVDPGVIAPGLNLARAEASLGHTAAAQIALRQVLSLHPDSEDAIRLLQQLEHDTK